MSEIQLGRQQSRDLRPDAQGFDEVHITTVPRYKTSELSGDEWRISAKIEFWRKGKVVHEQHTRDIAKACYHLGLIHDQALDNGKGFFGGEGDVCDQEGCYEKATVTYRKKQDYCRDGHAHSIEYTQKIRKFCARHSTRGDCGLDDADSNYEIIEGIKEIVKPFDERPSVFGGTIEIGRKARKSK